MDIPETRPTVEWILNQLPGEDPPRMAMILGSGWGPLVDSVVEIEREARYEDIPGYPVSTVEGHAGRLIRGRVHGVPLWVMQGRFHYYEGYSMRELTWPVRVLADLGVTGLVLTNAAGGIAPGFQPGQLMLIEDHINLMGDNPLRGPNDDTYGPRFPDLTDAWDAGLREVIEEAAEEQSISLQKGIYLAVSGPNFETPAEIRAFAGMGADAVGMSTVPECLVARHCGLHVVGLSCITNVAAHAGGKPLSHQEVSLAAERAQESICRLFSTAIPLIHEKLEN